MGAPHISAERSKRRRIRILGSVFPVLCSHQCEVRASSRLRSGSTTASQCTLRPVNPASAAVPIPSPPATRRRSQATAPYAIAIFLSSSMLFLIEPIAGKRLLPLLGGSAAVWTACLVFFQCALLLGYLTAHWLVTLTRPRLQIATYLVLLALSLGQLALAINPVLHATP